MFTDRKDAAEKLARSLEKYRGKDVLVLGIPRGGVETAFYIAIHLHADLSVIVARKLPFPYHPETAFGAIAEDGSIYISTLGREKLTKEEIEDCIVDQQNEVARKIQLLRHGKNLPDIAGKTVIIADDGIATGATLFAAIAMCKKRHAAKIIAAAPIAGQGMRDKLQQVADEIVILETPPNYTAVSQGYESFDNLTDEETRAFLEQWEESRRENHH